MTKLSLSTEFVSHSEMNVRHVADRCLLLFNGRQIALGNPDALFYKFYDDLIEVS